MRFFGRKKEEQPKEAGTQQLQPNALRQDAVALPIPAAPPPMPEPKDIWQPDQYAKVTDDGLVFTNVTSVAEARLAIKQLRLAKKELQARKKEIAALKMEENARWRETTAGRLPIARSGSSKSFLDNMVRAKRRSERMEHSNAINKLSDQMADLDSLILDIDREIMSMEALILRTG